MDDGTGERPRAGGDETRGGTRVALSLLIGALLAGTILSAVPEFRAGPVYARAEPVINAAGLDQNWGVFAPDPRGFVIDLFGRLDFADGTSAVWRPPSGGRALGAYRYYRWRKWVEHARADARSFTLWEPAARFVLNEHLRGGGRPPVRVALIRRWRDIPPPGGAWPPWNQYEYYSLEVGG